MKRHLAIGDIHGCSIALAALVESVGLSPDDTIVALGDYVDRGPDTAAVLDLLINLAESHELVALRGNHEVMMLDAMDKASWYEPWLRVGGKETLQSYSKDEDELATFEDIPAAHMDFLENRLVPFYECETHFFVHANADPAVALKDQTDPNLYWRRYQDPDRHCSGKIMVCGHSAQITGLPAMNDHSICIDTWPYGEGWLSCLDVGSGVLWQSNEKGDTRRIHIDELKS